MDTTDKELQAEYESRHRNLFHSMHGLFDTVDNALHNAFDEGQRQMQNAQDRVQSSSTMNEDNYGSDTRRTSSSSSTSSTDASTLKDKSQSVADEIKAEHRRNSIGFNINKSAMDATRRDLDAMREADAERFEPVGSKIEDTLGNTALVDDSLDRSAYRFPRRY
ncbi:hypothetical protein BDA99DRAFT_494971 [Phascolomyces articulosus]|uniref:Uncharacterized protein n=1 Tax=Phascolomyces articulosus TaxID=60185 RepID=A0AAD5KB76_9FUNG|nr:hypothetical protein BDA99DRAFT_494971 [Phascolomyces articulosus]